MTQPLADLRDVLRLEWRLQRARFGLARAALWMVPTGAALVIGRVWLEWRDR